MKFLKNSNTEYDALIQDESVESSIGNAAFENSETGPAPIQRTWGTLVHDIAIFIILLCSLIDVVVILCVFSGRAHFASPSSPKSLDDLELRSPYVHLDTLWKKKDFPRIQHERIINHARAIYQTSSTRPNAVLPVHTDMRLTTFGMAPLYTRRLFLDRLTSSLVQFRVMDFGMENCSLAITVPPRNGTKDIITGDSDGRATIEIWSLPPMSKQLDFRTLTWANKPKPANFFHSLSVEYGSSVETPQFHCPSLSHQTFEMSCSSPECHVDIMGVGSQSSGLHMWQYQSV